jgi:anthranilate phosphoribosyltransferase
VDPIAHNLELLRRVTAGGTLAESETTSLFDAVFSSHLEDAAVFELLQALSMRGPTLDELVGAARTMRRHATPVQLDAAVVAGRPILDTCGTGGAPKLFNVSTIGAIVTAAAAGGRVLVAKHGNRSRTGRGSAELLEALGVNIHASPAAQSRCLQEIGICFSFAPDHHPGARHAAAARKALGRPTIFNLLGPISNPAGATRQLIGTYSEHNAQLIASALARLGAEHAMVVTSHDGLDELTTSAPNWVFTVRGMDVARTILDAPTMNIPRATVAQLQADSLPQAVQVARSVLAGEPGVHTDLVALNVAASLIVAGISPDLGSGLDSAQEAMQSGRAQQTLNRWVQVSQV